MEIKILDKKGNYTGSNLSLDNNLFFKKSYDHSVYLEIKRYLSAQRQGTHKSKERSEVTGSNKKLYRQKGTGNARKGSIKNPIFRGGGRIFGPKPRSYIKKINKKNKILTRKFIIEYKLLKNKIKIVEDLKLNNPKTKIIIEFLRSLKLMNEKSLIVIGNYNKNIYLSFRNLKMHNLIHMNELNSYTLLNHSWIIFFKSSIEKIFEFLKH